MSDQKKIITLLVLLLATVPASLYAQMPGFIQRYDIGYSYSYMTATYNGPNQLYNPSTGTYSDTSVKKRIHSTGGFGGSASTFIPCKQLGEKSILAVSIGYNYNGYIFGNLYSVLTAPVDAANNASSSTTSAPPADNNDFTGVAVQMGLPVSLDFKFGNEAFIRKNQRFCATLGAGVYPSFTATVFKDDAGTGFGVQPFLKAEGGVLGGLVWKIRAVYAFGNFDLINKQSSLGAKVGEPGNFSLTSTSSFTLSLVIDPFAWHWKREGFWD